VPTPTTPESPKAQTPSSAQPEDTEEEPDDEFDEGGEEEEEEPPTPPPPPQGGPTRPPPVEKKPPIVSIAQVILVAPRSSYRVGENVTLQVQIVGAQSVGSVPFHLRYNPQVFSYLAPASEGDFLSSDGTSTVFAASEVQGGGEIVVGLSRVGAANGANGSGLLATFQFVAKAPGSGTFSFTGASVRDPTASILPSSFTTAAVSVQSN